MIAVDTNLLIYAHREDSPWHTVADRRLRDLVESGSPWAIPWPCVHEFLSIVTSPRVFAKPTPLARAIKQVEIWMESGSLFLLGEGRGHWQQLKSTLETGGITGPMVHDARVHAICRDQGVKIIWTADRDFARFHGLEVVNPLLPPE